LKRILLVDQNLKTVEQLRDPLEERAFDVEIALSSETGLEILQQRRVDAVLMSIDDAQEEDPATFVRGLRDRFPEVPVVLVSESVDTSELEPALGEALRASHRKPLSLDDLLADIERACR
jgi:two-component system copper resistance phosphate regulon response regulator CusR